MVSRSLATMLHSGVALLKALDVASRKTAHPGCRRALENVAGEIRAGQDLATAMRAQQGRFPELYIDMTAVAEQTGMLPEVLTQLADHYENLVRLRRLFLSMIAWPVIQLVAAILVVALLIFVLGILSATQGAPGAPPVDMLGWGLTGTSGTVIWLVLSFGSIFGVLASYYLAATVFRQKRFLDRLLMFLPVVGGCMRSFAIARFSWAFSLTQQTGMPISRSLELSFRATGNGAFMGASPTVCDLVMHGEELGDALTASGLFPEEYLHIVHVAETSGTVPEALARLSPQFEEQARRSLQTLAAAVGWLVWILVAALIIFVVFSLFLKYVGMINDAASGKF